LRFLPGTTVAAVDPALPRSVLCLLGICWLGAVEPKTIIARTSVVNLRIAEVIKLSLQQLTQ